MAQTADSTIDVGLPGRAREELEPGRLLPMRILIRTSKWAIWSRRFGSLALPLTVLPVFLHREQYIASADFVIMEAVAAGVAGLALFAAVGAFGRLWVTGDRGWGRAVSGLLLALVCLAPFGYLAVEAMRYPLVSEVATDYADPLSLLSPLRVTPTGPELQGRIVSIFPNATRRSYPVEATEMFEVVAGLAEARGWQVRTRRAPTTSLETGQLNVIATSLFGWRDEVALRVTGTVDGSTVDMRSVPLASLHDFGESGRRVEEFLLALDQQVTLLLRNAPLAASAGEAGEDGAVE